MYLYESEGDEMSKLHHKAIPINSWRNISYMYRFVVNILIIL